MVKPSIKKRALMRGTFSGALGIFLWTFAAIFLEPSSLYIWGWPIFIFGGLLILVGLLPYRRWSRLETSPHELTINEFEELTYYMQKQPVLRVKLMYVEEIAYLDDEERYGIGLWIKKPLLEHVDLINPSLNLTLFQEENQKNFFCDLYFPFFSKRSFLELEEAVKSSNF
jgi:hypothetical protein